MQGLLPARTQSEYGGIYTAPAGIATAGTASIYASNLLPADSSYVHALPDVTPRRQGRRVPLIVRVNRLLRTLLVTFCGVALLGYGLDVAASSEVAKLQEQARRLSEQNTELSAQLLRAISFQGIQANVVGRAGLRVPDHVFIVKEVAPPVVAPFHPNKYYLPLMSGY